MRGDGRRLAGSPRRRAGSPPRAWGRRSHTGSTHTIRRFTPTCVGTASGRRPRRAAATVHPHVRGDGPRAHRRRQPHGGSPPRAWGRRAGGRAAGRRRRFTPTCVGTATRRPIRACCPPVHPHVRGDGAPPSNIGSAITGSPPRAWGRRAVGIGCIGKHRFTPTCVGTASRVLATRRVETVHPHVRGDGVMELAPDRLLDGSPPRAWGRLVQHHGKLLRARFTPTCVGTAPETGLRPPHPSVHPHVRGDGRRQSG